MSQDLVTEEELRELALGGAAGFTTEQIAAAIRGASGIGCSALSAVHRMPLVSWGADVRLRVSQIAAYLLFSTRGFDAANASDQVRKMNHDDATTWFRHVAERKLRADVVDTSPAAAASPRVVSRPRRGYC